MSEKELDQMTAPAEEFGTDFETENPAKEDQPDVTETDSKEEEKLAEEKPVEKTSKKKAGSKKASKKKTPKKTKAKQKKADTAERKRQIEGDDKPTAEEGDSRTAAEKDIDRAISRLVSFKHTLGVPRVKRSAAMEFLRIANAIFIQYRGEKTGSLISRLVSGLKEQGIGEMKMNQLLTSNAITEHQRNYIMTVVTLFFNGSSEEGREQLRKQVSGQKILQMVGEGAYVTIEKWLGF